MLTFPIAKGISWSSNTRNSLERNEYTVTEKKTETINWTTLEDVITVEHLYETDPLQLNTEIKELKYAPNIGLVYWYEKRVKRFTTGEEDDTPIDSGFLLTKQIHQYGQR